MKVKITFLILICNIKKKNSPLDLMPQGSIIKHNFLDLTFKKAQQPWAALPGFCGESWIITDVSIQHGQEELLGQRI